MKKILTTFFTVMVVTGFVFSTPDSIIAKKLVQIQIDKIEAANIAFAQEEDQQPGDSGEVPWEPEDDNGFGDNQGMDVPICCSNGETPNSGEVCDNNICTPMCCPNDTNPNMGYRCDNTLVECGWGTEEDDDEEKKKVCDDVNAKNYQDPTAPGREPGGVCEYNYICCVDNENVLNYAGDAACNDLSNRPDPFMCITKAPVCCDAGWDTYQPASGRDRDVQYCVYDSPTCSCYGSAPHTGSQCGGSNEGEYCTIETSFSVVKSGVAIGGSAQMDTIAECESEDEETLENYVAGAAAADATPDTPLNTPIQLDSLSSYTVTSKDYCLNVAGVQSSASGYNRSEGGLCCEQPNVPDELSNSCLSGPQCGTAAGQTSESAPSTDLCQNGSPSAVNTNTTTYTWSCSTESEGNTYDTQCSANRTCNGESCEVCTDLDCGPNDQCKNITGNQNASYLSANNVASDNYGVCWNATTGACGSVSQIPYVTETPTTNLCISGTHSSPVSFDDGSGLYSWDCISNTNSNNISPACQVRQCVGNECQTEEADGLIKKFKAEPSIVSRAGGECTLTWETNVDSTITDPAQGCQVNGNSVIDNNMVGTRVGPGTYSLMCHLGVTFQIETVKCVMSPDFREI